MTLEGFDPDIVVRLKCLEAVQMLVESHAAVGQMLYADATSMADAVNELAHAVTQGKDVGVIVSDHLAKCVR